MPLFWISLAFLCGIVIGAQIVGINSAWLAATTILGFVALLAVFCYQQLDFPQTRFRRWIAGIWPANHETLLPGYLIPFLPLILLLGARYFQASLPDINPSHIAWHSDQEQVLVVEGRVVADPEFRDAYTLLVVDVEGLRSKESDALSAVHGRMQTRLLPGGDWRYGDRVQVEGRLKTPFENDVFSYRDYLAHHGIYTTLTCTTECARLLQRETDLGWMTVIYRFRRQAQKTVHRLFTDPEAGLLAGILLGIETGIPEDVMNAFRQTGTSHIIAISGFNFAIIAGLLVLVFERLLGRWQSLPVTWLGIAAYALVAGANPSVIRAAIMGSLSVFSMRIGRRSSGVNTLTFVAMVMALIDPHVLWDVGFQLSFMATLGLMLYAEPLTQSFKRLAGRLLPPPIVSRLVGPMSEYLLFTLAAQITTLPLILYVFHQASLVSLIANPLVLPAQPLLMVLGGLATLLGLVFQPLGQLAAYFAWPFIAYTIRIVEVLAETNLASMTFGPLSLTWLVGFYVLLFSWTLWGGRLKELAARKLGHASPRLGWTTNLGLALLAVLVWQRVLALPDGRLYLTVLDVGSGDAIFIRSPSGRSLLVDGGPSPNALADGIGRRLLFGNREIDYLVIAGTGEQQIAALPLALDRFRVRNVLWAGPPAGSYSARELRKRLAEDQLLVVEMQAGHRLDLGEGVWLEAISVTRRGAVLLLTWDRFRALLPIGLDFDSLGHLLKDQHGSPVTALLLADSGFAPLNPPEWIERWMPQVALLSVAAGNKEGLPHPETLAALEGIPLLRTDWNGWIEVSTDGEQMWVEVERK